MVRNPERIIVSLVDTGELTIAKSGKIWRHKIRKGIKRGGSALYPVKKRRAEHRVPLGYLQIRALINGKRYYASAHRLIWQHFNEDIPEGMVINHKNGVKCDNRLNNLEVITHSENMKHAYRTGLKNQDGEKNPNNKLSNKEVEEIRNLYKTGEYRQATLAKKFGVSFQAISRIVRGEGRKKQNGPVGDYVHRRQGHCVRDAKGRFLSKKAAGSLLDGKLWRGML